MMFMDRLCTDFLFARPSFLSGIARVLDIFGIFDSYNQSRNGQEADAIAIRSDWAMVGQDITDACSTFERELQAERSKQLTLPLAMAK